MLSKKQLQHLASLARLSLTEKERQRYRREISSILDYVSKLKEAEISQVEEKEWRGFNNLRSDQVKKCKEPERLIKMAPQREGRLIKVGKVI